MYCSNCGTYNEKDNRFCINCGQEVLKNIESPNQSTPVVNPAPAPNPNPNPAYFNNAAAPVQAAGINPNIKRTNLALGAVIIGAISIVLVFLLQIFIIPLALVGLILAIAYKEKSTQKTVAIVLNAISIVLAVPILILYSTLLFSLNKNVVGTWNCGSLESSSNYVVQFTLNRDNTFVWSKYGDSQNNYVKGKYELEDLNKTNQNGNFSYYKIKLIGREFVEEGERQNTTYTAEYEMGVGTSESDTIDSAVLYNASTSSLYFCRIQK